MAKANNQSGGERSRARIVVLDFDLAGGDMNQLAGAILSAIKPPLPVVTALPAAPPKARPCQQNGNQASLLEQQIQAEEQKELPPQYDTPVAGVNPTNGVRKKKRLRTPKPLHLDLVSGDKPFKDYHDQIGPKSDSRRYLVIAQWLKVYRGITEIGADHVYTCYRRMSRQVPGDVLSVFRGLKKQGWVETGSAPGLFKINHIGENQLVQKE